MNLLTRIRHKIGKWLWKENAWTKAVEDIENAVYDLKANNADECEIKWQFKFIPPPNKFTCHIKFDK